MDKVANGGCSGKEAKKDQKVYEGELENEVMGVNARVKANDTWVIHHP